MRQVRISVMSSFLLLCFMAEPKAPKTHSHASEKNIQDCGTATLAPECCRNPINKHKLRSLTLRRAANEL